MARIDMRDLLRHAQRNGYAVGSFNVVSLDTVQAVIRAAEACRAPVIVGVSEPHFDHVDPEILLPAIEAAARRTEIPVAILLDHATSVESAARGIRLGCNGVRLDVSRPSFSDTVAASREVVEMSHACGVAVEGELGYVTGAYEESARSLPDVPHHPSVEQAQAYVERTGVDFLTVDIGSAHGRLRGQPRPDFQHLARIRDALAVPLAIHGGNSLAEDQYGRLIACGIARIGYFAGRSESASCAPEGRDLRLSATTALQDETARYLRLGGSAGRAAEVLAGCRPWKEVEHLVAYNVHGLSAAETTAMIRRGCEVLSVIPGVRRVLAGTALREDARYRLVWLVRFASVAVVDSYREHPAHKAFADTLFRPYAADRLSIDYELLAAAEAPPPAPGDDTDTAPGDRT